jgi:hypothetical protein
VRSKLIDDLDDHFMQQSMFVALGVVHPQYWMQKGCKASFGKYLEIMKGFYCEVKSTKVGDGTKHFMPLSDR